MGDNRIIIVVVIIAALLFSGGFMTTGDDGDDTTTTPTTTPTTTTPTTTTPTTTPTTDDGTNVGLGLTAGYIDENGDWIVVQAAYAPAFSVYRSFTAVTDVYATPSISVSGFGINSMSISYVMTFYYYEGRVSTDTEYVGMSVSHSKSITKVITDFDGTTALTGTTLKDLVSFTNLENYLNSLLDNAYFLVAGIPSNDDSFIISSDVKPLVQTGAYIDTESEHILWFRMSNIVVSYEDRWGDSGSKTFSDKVKNYPLKIGTYVPAEEPVLLALGFSISADETESIVLWDYDNMSYSYSEYFILGGFGVLGIGLVLVVIMKRKDVLVKNKKKRRMK